MSDTLEQAIIAIKTGDKAGAGQLLIQVLQADPRNTSAWVWLASLASTDERRRACLDRALAIDPDHPEVRQALFDWILGEAQAPVAAAEGELPQPGLTPPTNFPTPPPLQPAVSGGPIAATSPQQFMLELSENLETLKQRRAKYGDIAAPFYLLQQIEDYEQAMTLVREAIDGDVPLAELQAELSTLNLEISGVVIMSDEPPRQPFTGENPYPGLQKFTEIKAEFFFGRTAAIQSLLNIVQYLVEKETSAQTPDLIAVLGASGSGKSSLVQAGLIPALRNGRIPGSQHWPIKVILPGAHPLDALAEIFAPELKRSAADLHTGLTGGERSLHYLIKETLTGKPEDAIFVLVVDQFEELFTLTESEAERQAFLAQLLYACQVPHNRSFVVLTMRADFYAKASAYKRLAEAITRHQILVSPMTERELREAILLPAEKVGLELKQDLLVALLKDTAGAPGVLPLLQQCLVELFRRRNSDNQLTLETYEAINGVKGALAHHADTVVNALPPEQQALARRIFLRLVQLGEGTADTRRRATFDELLTRDDDQQQVEAVVQKLADESLIVTDTTDSDQQVLDVAHEALIQAWPRLGRWLNEDRESLRIRQQIHEDAQEWQARHKDDESLYQEKRLGGLEDWLKMHRRELNAEELAFVEASERAVENKRTQAEAERQQELEQAKARARAREKAALRQRKLTFIATGVGFLAITAAIVATVLGYQSNLNAELAATKAAEAKANADQAATREAEAKQAQNDALSLARLSHLDSLGAQIRANLDTKLDQALLLGLEVGHLQEIYQMSDPVQAEGSILAGLTHHPQLKKFLFGHDNYWVYSLATSPDGKILASGDTNGTIVLWDAATGQQLGQLTSDPFDVHSLAFSPDGKLLASGSPNNAVILWNVAKRQRQGEPLIGHESVIWSLAFSPDGRTLASGDEGGLIRLWDVAQRKQQANPLKGHEDRVNSLAFNRDGELLASGSSDYSVILWDIAGEQSPRQRVQFTDHQDWVNSVAFSPDGKILASGSEDDTIILWDVAKEQPRGEPLTGHQGGVTSVTFSPDGQTLASGSVDTTIMLWDVASGRQRGAPLAGHGNVVNAVAFSRDQMLASADNDALLILWDLTTVSPLGVSLTGHEGLVFGVDFRDDQTLISGAGDGILRLWQRATGQPEGQPLAGHNGSIYTIALSADKKTLAAGYDDGVIVLWDLSQEPRQGQTLTGHQNGVNGLAFSPDGKTLASGSGDGSIILWDLAKDQPRDKPLANESGVISLAFSPDGRTLAAGGFDTVVTLWDVSNEQLPDVRSRLSGHGAGVYSVAFSPDPDLPLLASASEDGSIILWDVSNPPDAKSPEAASEPLLAVLIGHKGIVYSVAFSPDGSTLASGGLDNSVILWDVATALQGGDALIGAPLTGHHAEVWTLAFSPDGKTLASGSADNSIILWNLDIDSWPTLACQRANRNLNQAEWDAFIGSDTPYQPTCPNLPPGAGVAEVTTSH